MHGAPSTRGGAAAEREPDFAKKVIEQLGQDAKIIVACDIGGTLTTTVKSSGKEYDDPERAFGRESRCGAAARQLHPLASGEPVSTAARVGQLHCQPVASG